VNAVRVSFTIAYDGVSYHGWHAGRSGCGIADLIEKALADLFPSAPLLCSASRTDSGVHALGMVAHVDIPVEESSMPFKRMVPALNALLPDDIRILSASQAQPSFHARFDAVSKQYRYQIWNAPVMNPLMHQRAWHVAVPLDVKSMRKAALLLCGSHDFRAFTSKRDGTLGKTTRHLFRCEIRRSGPLLTLILEGDGFLYKMCRAIAGTLVKVGNGKMSYSDVQVLLDHPTTPHGCLNAPAHGLVLWRVNYHSDPRRC
jgi:tRNA pseudouridine38-40 synthase